jgi:hypothetical protein
LFFKKDGILSSSFLNIGLVWENCHSMVMWSCCGHSIVIQ